VAKIIFSKTAKFDLKEIIEYIKRDSIRYASLEKRKIIEAIDQLPKQPFIGRIVPELNDRIIYQIISENQINILTIHYHSRLITNNPAFKPEE
jgi:plasmid stabilization system protein ParE